MKFKPTTGEDAFGKWRMHGDQHCIACGRHVLTLRYASLHLPEPDEQVIEVSRTILKQPRAYIGINCGDYAKFHRQVAHIVDSMKGRS